MIILKLIADATEMLNSGALATCAILPKRGAGEYGANNQQERGQAYAAEQRTYFDDSLRQLGAA
jgi:hypothetical protein